MYLMIQILLKYLKYQINQMFHLYLSFLKNHLSQMTPEYH
jgi:hypothetical protein